MKTENFLFFIKENEVVAVKIAAKRNDSQAFIYRINSQKIEKSHSGSDSTGKEFLSKFTVPNEKEGISIVSESGCEYWRFIDYLKAKEFHEFMDQLKKVSNEEECEETWRNSMEDHFKNNTKK